MDISAVEWVGLAASSGVAAGLANNLLGVVRDLLGFRSRTKSEDATRKHNELMHDADLAAQRTLQREQREHEEAERKKTDFYQARDRCLPMVMRAEAWVNWAWGSEYGAEVEYYPISLQEPEHKTAGPVIAELYSVASSHPSKPIRGFARALADSIDGVVNMPDGGGDATPSVTNFSDWLKRSRALIDALHDPAVDPSTAVG